MQIANITILCLSLSLTDKNINSTTSRASVIHKITLSKQNSVGAVIAATVEVRELHTCTAIAGIVTPKDAPFNQRIQLIVGMALRQNEQTSAEKPHRVILKDAVKYGQCEVVQAFIQKYSQSTTSTEIDIGGYCSIRSAKTVCSVILKDGVRDMNRWVEIIIRKGVITNCNAT